MSKVLVGAAVVAALVTPAAHVAPVAGAAPTSAGQGAAAAPVADSAPITFDLDQPAGFEARMSSGLAPVKVVVEAHDGSAPRERHGRLGRLHRCGRVYEPDGDYGRRLGGHCQRLRRGPSRWAPCSPRTAPSSPCHSGATAPGHLVHRVTQWGTSSTLDAPRRRGNFTVLRTALHAFARPGSTGIVWTPLEHRLGQGASGSTSPSPNGRGQVGDDLPAAARSTPGPAAATRVIWLYDLLQPGFSDGPPPCSSTASAAFPRPGTTPDSGMTGLALS